MKVLFKLLSYSSAKKRPKREPKRTSGSYLWQIFNWFNISFANTLQTVQLNFNKWYKKGSRFAFKQFFKK